MNLKVKKLYFGDIRKVAQVFSALELKPEQVKKIYTLLNDLLTSMRFPNVESADAYLRETLSKEIYKKEYQNMSDELKVQAASMLKLSKENFVDTIIEQGLFLIELLANKFDVIVDFIDYFITNVTVAQINEFDGKDLKNAITAIFTDVGFLKFFQGMFN